MTSKHITIIRRNHEIYNSLNEPGREREGGGGKRGLILRFRGINWKKSFSEIMLHHSTPISEDIKR